MSPELSHCPRPPQVSFELLIPCMLFSKVASTLSAHPDPTLLLGIAVAALAQIVVGAACGLLLTPLFGLSVPAQAETAGGAGGGWRGSSSPAAASAIALSLSSAAGTPQATAALRPRQAAPRGGVAQMVAPSCAFGNSFTLPAIFFATLLPPALADRALGYAALFLLAWSPCLWSLGMSLVGAKLPPPQAQGGGATPQQEQQQEEEGGGGAPTPLPLKWRQPRIVDVTPLSVRSRSSSGGGSDDEAEGSSSGGGTNGGGGSQLQEMAPAPPSWAEWLAMHPVTARLVQFAGQVLNPPVLAIIAGAVVGFSPLGRTLLASAQGGAAGAGAAVLPPELGLMHGFCKAVLEVGAWMAGRLGEVSHAWGGGGDTSDGQAQQNPATLPPTP